MSEEKPKREFIFATYTKNRIDDTRDLLVVKEHLHYPNGEIKPNLRHIENYPRTFYITKPEYRDHEQKKEFEYLDKLDEHQCIQAQLVKKASRALGMWGCYKPAQVGNSPYLYGSDVSTPTILAHSYKAKDPTLSSPAKLAVNDYETDMIKGDGTIIIGTISCKDKATVSIRRDFLDKNNLPQDEKVLIPLVRKRIDELIGKHLKARNVDLDIKIRDTNVHVVKDCLDSAHAWKPDYVGYWNMGFDMDHMTLACNMHNVKPETIFCDPSVPPEYRSFRYIKDKPIKRKADGTTIAKHWADLWHKVITPASFQFVCMMAFYKHNRVREQQLNSYSLDAVLKRHTDVEKLKLDEVDAIDQKDWHVIMQRDHPLEYIAYALFDVISCEILDETTNDIAQALRPALRISEVTSLKSTPKQRSDGFHFTLLEEGKVIASTGETMVEPYDRHTPASTGWIVTLPAELEFEMGVSLINEYPDLETNVVTHSLDSDVKSCYPTAGAVLNVGKSTSRVEVCGIMKEDDSKTRRQGINMTALRTNALEIARDLYNYPDPEDVLEAFMRQ